MIVIFIVETFSLVCFLSAPAVYRLLPPFQHGRAGAGKTDAQQGDSGLRFQRPQTGQHRHCNAHGQGQCPEDQGQDLTNRFFSMAFSFAVCRFPATLL